MADEGVACAALGERARSSFREPAVVDETGATERGEGVDASRLVDPTCLEVALDLGGAAFPVAQRAERLLDRVFCPPASALDRDRLLGLDLDDCLLARSRRQETRRDDLLVGGLRLDPGEDLLDEVGVLGEEARGVLAALAETLVAEAEVRARFLDDLLLETDVEDGALPRDARPVDDVELGLLERRRDLVLDDLDPDAVAERLGAVLQRLDPADVETDRRVELERAAARASSPGSRT